MVLLRGFRFGMLLQLAIGPVGLFVFQTASTQGVRAALPGVLAVSLVDAAFIVAAIFGIGALLEKSPRAKSTLRIFGAVVLALFGLSMVLGAFGVHVIPGLGAPKEGGAGVFWYTLLLTASSPLTIVFWAGVFSAKIAQGGMSRRELYLFGLGAVLSTLVCFTLLCAAGGLAKGFVPPVALMVLNVAVGCALIVFGARTALRKA